MCSMATAVKHCEQPRLQESVDLEEVLSQLKPIFLTGMGLLQVINLQTLWCYWAGSSNVQVWPLKMHSRTISLSLYLWIHPWTQFTRSVQLESTIHTKLDTTFLILEVRVATLTTVLLEQVWQQIKSTLFSLVVVLCWLLVALSGLWDGGGIGLVKLDCIYTTNSDHSYQTGYRFLILEVIDHCPFRISLAAEEWVRSNMHKIINPAYQMILEVRVATWTTVLLG